MWWFTYYKEVFNDQHDTENQFLNIRHILTAAHCKGDEGKPYEIYLGSHNKTADEENGVQPIQATSDAFHPYPTFDREKGPGDIAIITLPEDIEFNKTVRKAITMNLSLSNRF